jgi:hypothetical protein
MCELVDVLMLGRTVEGLEGYRVEMDGGPHYAFTYVTSLRFVGAPVIHALQDRSCNLQLSDIRYT